MERAERTRILLEAGTIVVSRLGFHGMTMRDVAREADVGTATLYRYFENREQLLYRIWEMVLTAAIASAQASLMARGKKERLKSLVTDHIRRILARPAEQVVHGGPPPPLREPRKGRIEELRATYRAIVREAAAPYAGGFKSRREGDRAVSLLLAMAERQALETLWRGGASARPAQIAAPVLLMFERGTRSPARRAASKKARRRRTTRRPASE